MSFATKRRSVNRTMKVVDNDGVPEVIIGDGQWGNVHVHDLVNQALKWEVNNPEHGVTNIAIGDVDYDGVVDLLWGAGATSSGPDRLYVANTTGAHDIKWQNLDLEGPFLGAANGDLDGDGQSELVISSTSSDAGYSSGRILVFDLSTLVLRAISPPVANGFSAYGVHHLKLRDVEGNGRMQIVIATESGYDGLIEIYRFVRSGQNCVFSSGATRRRRPRGRAAAGANSHAKSQGYPKTSSKSGAALASRIRVPIQKRLSVGRGRGTGIARTAH